MCEEFVG